jgi:hypothetical protein
MQHVLIDHDTIASRMADNDYLCKLVAQTESLERTPRVSMKSAGGIGIGGVLSSIFSRKAQPQQQQQQQQQSHYKKKEVTRLGGKKGSPAMAVSSSKVKRASSSDGDEGAVATKEEEKEKKEEKEKEKDKGIERRQMKRSLKKHEAAAAARDSTEFALRRNSFSARNMAKPSQAPGSSSSGQISHGSGPPPASPQRISHCAPPPAPAASMSHMRPLDHFVNHQKANGSWLLDENLAQAVGKSLDELTSGMAAGVPAEAWATALALAALEAKFANQREEWDLLAGKARRWLARELAKLTGDNTKTMDSLLADATAILAQ